MAEKSVEKQEKDIIPKKRKGEAKPWLMKQERQTPISTNERRRRKRTELTRQAKLNCCKLRSLVYNQRKWRLTKEKKKMEVAEAKGIMEMGNQTADPKVAVVVHY